MKKVSSGLNSLKNKVVKLDVDKLITVPVDLIKLSNIINNDVIKNDVHNTDN